MEFVDLFYLVVAGLVVYYLLTPRSSSSTPPPARKQPARSKTKSRRSNTGSRKASGLSRSSSSKQTGSTDPKDTPVYLEHRGWTQISRSPEKYVGQYQTNGTAVSGGLERTKSGRRKFIVHNPPRALKRAAHGGRCLQPRPDLGPNTYEVHFNRPPASFGDGIDTVTAMVEGTHA